MHYISARHPVNTYNKPEVTFEIITLLFTPQYIS